MTAWRNGAGLDKRTFAALFFSRRADDPIVRSIHVAALGAAKAINHQDLRDASDKIAEAIKGVGADRWPRFVADAEVRANSPLAVAAVEKSQQPIDPAREAIRPVYPLETAIGVAPLGSPEVPPLQRVLLEELLSDRFFLEAVPRLLRQHPPPKLTLPPRRQLVFVKSLLDIF